MIPLMLRTASVRFSDIQPPATRHRRRRNDGALVLRRSPDGDGYVVVDGHRAYEAFERARVERALCLVRQDDPTDPLDLLAEIRGLGGRDPIEEAEAIQQALERLGVTQHELARITGLRQPQISRRLKLLSLSPRDRRLLRDGLLTIEEAMRQARSRTA